MPEIKADNAPPLDTQHSQPSVSDEAINADYTMSIALTTLKHLGIGLYSNIPAVLSEVVANSWDADAENVSIEIDKQGSKVTITDDGCGMTKEEINHKYLQVGWNKRENDGAITPKDRHVMGRKGIGKLALFSIADRIELHTVKTDCDGATHRNGLVMKSSDIAIAINESKEYHPKSVASERIDLVKGTRIILTDLKNSLDVTAPFLRKRLARRFSIINSDNHFSVSVNGDEVSIADRDYFGAIEYVWGIGDSADSYIKQCPNAQQSEKVDGVVAPALGYKISGWVGTIDEQKHIDEGNNTIVVLAWGKLIHEDILKDMKETGVYASYLIGEIRADFLDQDGKEDIVTSDRQSLKETDPRFDMLKNHIRSAILKSIQSKWTDWRNNDAERKATQNPKIKEWYDSLQNDNKKYAKSLFGKIQAFPIKDENYRRELYKHGILAFETLALNQNLAALNNIATESDMQTFRSVFASIDELGAAHYYQIIKGRLAILDIFESVAPAAAERVVHDHIYNHLWLLDPSWERASTDARSEQNVMNEFKKIEAKLTNVERDGRIDIRYRTAAGKHIIIELKKGDRKVTAFELAAQVAKYRNALKKCLDTVHPNIPKVIEIICLVGPVPEPHDDLKQVDQTLAAVDARYITYDTLIQQTRDSYRQYLDAQKEISKIQELIDSI